jgi:hypothetical protein
MNEDNVSRIPPIRVLIPKVDDEYPLVEEYHWKDLKNLLQQREQYDKPQELKRKNIQ